MKVKETTIEDLIKIKQHSQIETVKDLKIFLKGLPDDMKIWSEYDSNWFHPTAHILSDDKGKSHYVNIC